MASKTVNLSEEAYSRLNSLKREGESFSDVVNRLTGKYALLELVGVLDEDETELFEQAARDVEERLRGEIDGTGGSAS